MFFCYVSLFFMGGGGGGGGILCRHRPNDLIHIIIIHH